MHPLKHFLSCVLGRENKTVTQISLESLTPRRDRYEKAKEKAVDT